MSDPMVLDDATPRFGLPLLYAGQAQKEVFVNEAILRADVLLHCAVIAELASPPSSPDAGQTWLVAPDAIGAWSGRSGSLATFQGGGWTFVSPREGLRIYNSSDGQECFFSGSWRKASPIVEPLGGSIVDGEARAAIADLVSALQALGALPSA